jgi:hypothetical protein
MNLVCDFCLEGNPRWAYPARDFDLQVGPVAHHSQGGWAACPTCHDLIERDDFEQLLQRAAGAFAPESIREVFRRLFDIFRQHRTGPAERIDN